MGQYYDVVIVGGGLAGASTALAIHNAGLKVLLLEAGQLPPTEITAAQELNQYDRRVSALTEGSRRWLEKLSV